ncbi:MAG: hypothetical protein IKF39_13150 [Oscillospiraceae bacterium]|nr:hypothetical protein [Oscillospiraceae bacterium]
MIFLFFVFLGLVFEGLRFMVRVAGKLAGILFGLAVLCAVLSIAGTFIGLVWRMLPAMVLVTLLLSMLSVA